MNAASVAGPSTSSTAVALDVNRDNTDSDPDDPPTFGDQSTNSGKCGCGRVRGRGRNQGRGQGVQTRKANNTVAPHAHVVWDEHDAGFIPRFRISAKRTPKIM